jgi:threonine synthase
MIAHQFSNLKQENAMQNLEQAIRERAYHLWIAAGCPEGNSDAHWLDAQRALLATSVAVAEPAGAVAAKPKLKTRKKSADKPKDSVKAAPARSKRKVA